MTSKAQSKRKFLCVRIGRLLLANDFWSTFTTQSGKRNKVFSFWAPWVVQTEQWFLWVKKTTVKKHLFLFQVFKYNNHESPYLQAQQGHLICFGTHFLDSTCWKMLPLKTTTSGCRNFCRRIFKRWKNARWLPPFRP